MATACTAVRHGQDPGWRVGGLARFLLGGCLFLGCGITAVGAPTVSKMLEYRPRQDVAITTPAQADHASCKVELLKGTGKASAWVLKDNQGKEVVAAGQTLSIGDINGMDWLIDGVVGKIPNR